MIRCDACNGRKQIMGLGNMIKDCDSCKGIGWLEKQDDKLKVTLADVVTPKRKRRKKVNSEEVINCQEIHV